MTQTRFLTLTRRHVGEYHLNNDLSGHSATACDPLLIFADAGYCHEPHDGNRKQFDDRRGHRIWAGGRAAGRVGCTASHFTPVASARRQNLALFTICQMHVLKKISCGSGGHAILYSSLSTEWLVNLVRLSSL